MSNQRFSDSMDLQDITRPRSQPIRLKALLHFCESDDDDDDESEDKPLESEDESDSDEPQPLPQDRSIESTLLLESSQCKASVNHLFVSDAEDNKDRFPKLTEASLEKNCEIAIDISPTQEKINCAKEDKQECKVDANSIQINLPFEKTNKLETHDYKREEEMQENQEGLTIASRTHQSNANLSMDIVLPSSIYKRDYNAKLDDNKNFPSSLPSQLSTAQSHYENAYIPDILNKKEGHASSDNKRLLMKNIESYLLNMSKEDRRYRGVQSSMPPIEQKIDREEKYCPKFPNLGSESTSCTNSQTTSENLYPNVKSQYNEHAKYEANEKYVTENSRIQFSTPSMSNTAKLLSSMSQLATETPLKHMQMGTMHPNLCSSHKQLFCTSQSKLPDDPNKNHVQTPSTILFNRPQGNMKQTPIDGKKFVAKDCMQTSRNTICTSTIGKGESSRCVGMDAKNIRRPLVDAVLTYNESSAYPLESKSLVPQTSTETKCTMVKSQQEDRSRKMTGLPEVKLMQTEGNYENNLKSADLLQEIKENKQPNVPNILLGSNRKTIHDKKNKPMMIGSTTNAKIIQGFEEKYKSEDIIPNIESKYKNSYDPHMVHEKQREALRHIVDGVGSIQFSIPSSIPSQREYKTLFVKDREYLILGSLGHGMCGEVLRVQDMAYGELRAIKCVNLSKMDKESAQGCLDEISLLRKLQAPCVVRMFDYHIKESMVYVVMEMGDTDLSTLLKSMLREKQISLTMILYYWTEMLTAVKHIHDNGVIHSDLKPANFLLVRGRLKLIDFGIASNMNSDMTSVLKTNAIGTLNYISPEALMDIGGSADSPTHNMKYKISFKSDVWSLGCILYSLVYGHTPFHHIRSQWAKVNAITNPKPNISFPTMILSVEGECHERTPPVLMDVMQKCLRHDPKARPTVSQLLQIQYAPNRQDAVQISTPNIPADIIVNIKNALNEEQWRRFVQILGTK